MEKYIKQLLSEKESRVIIPGFGAIQAMRDENGTSLSFNKYLNFDDSKLTSKVSEGEGMTQEEAAKYVAEKASEYKAELEEKKELTLAGIGRLTCEEDGMVTFEQDADYEDSVPEAAAETKIEEPAQEAETTEEKEESAPEVEEAKIVQPEPKQDEEKSDKRKLLLILLILLLLLLGLGLALLVFNQDNPVYNFFFGAKAETEQTTTTEPAEPTTEPAAEVAPEPEKKEEPAAAEPKKENKVMDTTAARPLEKRYNIIVGSYRDLAVAQKRVADLQSKGFSESYVGIKGEYYVAVIGSFSNITEAEKKQEEIVDGPYHIESWMTNSGE